MKDAEARAVINLLTERIKDLESFVQKLQHLENCECNYCDEHKPDHSAMDLRTSPDVTGGIYAKWWKREG